MQRGDLANAVTPRWMFTLDVLTDGKPLPKKRLWKSWEDILIETPLSKEVLGAVWLFWRRTNVVIMLATFGVPAAYCLALEALLERQGQYPIKYVEPFHNRQALVESLTYRHDIQGVVDLPEHAGKYGSLGWTMKDVSRVGR